MGVCCSSRMTLNGSRNNQQKGGQKQEAADSYNFQVVQSNTMSLDLHQAESYAIKNPQKLFRYTNVNKCFKHAQDIQDLDMPKPKKKRLSFSTECSDNREIVN